jgi:N-acetylmuramoyl-L-alanine amidase
MHLSNRYGILALFLFLSALIANVSANKSGEDTFVLVIDAGHGGLDPGALGKNSKEKDINLAVTRLVGDAIMHEHRNVKVIYTREQDVYITLKQRTDIANKANADLFISIHSNASKKSSASGAEVYILGIDRKKENLEVVQRENNVIYREENYEENYIKKYKNLDPSSPEFLIINGLAQNKYMKRSLEFASLVQNELITTAKRKNNGVKQAGFWVLVGAGMPSILVELDFISNSESEKFLSGKEGQLAMAKAITNAFSEYKKEIDYKKEQNAFSPEEKDEKPQIVAEERNEPEAENNAPVQNSTEIVYKVQIFVTSRKLPDHSEHFKGYKADFYIENSLYKYTYGESSDLNKISQIRKSLLKDFKDAFIVKFKNGEKVSN